MDRREFLKKFVALSSASLVISSCTNPKPLSTPNSSSKIHPNISNLNQEEPITPIPPPKKSVPLAVYGPPPIP
jgi:hypothetical protein